MQRPEQAAQIAVVSYLRPAIIRPARFWFVPNGVGAMSKGVAGIYRSMGLTTGIHDLHFIWEAENAYVGEDGIGITVGRFGTIEMKDPKGGRLEDSQAAFGADMDAIGHHWAEARTLDEVIGHLTAWGVPLRSPNETVKFAFKNGFPAIKAFPSDRFR